MYPLKASLFLLFEAYKTLFKLFNISKYLVAIFSFLSYYILQICKGDWFFGVDMGIYYDPDQPAIIPNGFLSLGVERVIDEEHIETENSLAFPNFPVKSLPDFVKQNLVTGRVALRKAFRACVSDITQLI